MSLVIALAAFVLYIIAYNTYGRYLARKLFRLDPHAHTPAHELSDGVDYVPSRKQIVFGHHFTSIAGTGPIVGPALAIIWGWVPALIWIVVGSIFMGAVHDFGSLVVSMRHKGRSLADVCDELINPRVRFLFLTIVTFGLIIVIAIFCLVIASIFEKSPRAVIPVWCEIPIAIGLGLFLKQARTASSVVVATVIAVVLMYFTVWVGYRVPVTMGSLGSFGPGFLWAVILLAYCFVASVLPVQVLLQPRDFINAYQLYIALALVFGGVLLTSPGLVAPAANMAPRLAADPATKGVLSPWPLLFVVVACGAISGFHSLVSGGTTSKQLSRETDAQAIGYGSMLLEGMLAVLVIISVGAGLGLRAPLRDVAAFQQANPAAEIKVDDVEGKRVSYVTGKMAFKSRYDDWATAKDLAVNSFMNGASNMMTKLGLPFALCMTIMGVFVASFAGTTLDTATRLQRYIIGEFGSAAGVKVLANRYVATAVTVIAGGALALHDGKGEGALILWPLFGTLNQLIAALALMVVSVYLHKKGRPIWVTGIPFLIMVVITGWAMVVNLRVFLTTGEVLLFIIGLIVAALEVWMIVEVVLHITRKKRPDATPAG